MYSVYQRRLSYTVDSFILLQKRSATLRFCWKNSVLRGRCAARYPVCVFSPAQSVMPELLYSEANFTDLKNIVSNLSSRNIPHYVGGTHRNTKDELRSYQQNRRDIPRNLRMIMYFQTENVRNAENILLATGRRQGRTARRWNNHQVSNLRDEPGYVYVRFRL